MIESQLRSSELWVLLRYPGLRPLRGRCPGLTLRLAATRLPVAMRLFFVGIRCGAESQLRGCLALRAFSLWEFDAGDRVAAVRPSL